MQQISLRKYIWRIFSPLILQTVVAFLVEAIIIGIYTVIRLPEYKGAITTSEQMIEFSAQITNELYRYITEISAIAALVAIPFLGLMIYKDRKNAKKMGIIPNKKANLFQYSYIIGISIALSLGLNNILLLSNLAEYSESYQETATILYAPAFPVQILCVGIIIPIMEEMVFRGLVYKRMKESKSMFYALLTSSVLFGVYHGNSVQFIYALLTGVMLGYLYEKYGSLKAPILAHMLMNIVSCVLTKADVFTWIFSNMARMATITIGCAAVGSTMFVMIRGINEKTDTKDEEKL